MKRLARWPQEDRRWVDSLPAAERELVLEAIAFFDARPEDVRQA